MELFESCAHSMLCSISLVLPDPPPTLVAEMECAMLRALEKAEEEAQLGSCSSSSLCAAPVVADLGDALDAPPVDSEEMRSAQAWGEGKLSAGTPMNLTGGGEGMPLLALPLPLSEACGSGVKGACMACVAGLALAMAALGRYWYCWCMCMCMCRCEVSNTLSMGGMGLMGKAAGKKAAAAGTRVAVAVAAPEDEGHMGDCKALLSELEK